MKISLKVEEQEIQLLLYKTFSHKVFGKPRWRREKMVLCYQNCSDLMLKNNYSSDWEKKLKFEAEGREFAKFLRSLEQFVQTVKGQNNF